MIKTINYLKNPHQKEFHSDIKSKRLHLSTGFGGGKTYALIMKMLQLSMLNKDLHGGFMSPTYAEFKKDVLPLTEEILDANKIPFKYHGSDHYFSLPWTKGRVYVVSGERKIRGPNWAYACINELTLCPLVRYKEVLGRVRIKTASNPQVASVGTPEGMASEYYDYMIEKPRKNFKIIYGDTRNNKQNLTDTYIEDLEDSYDSVMQDAYVRGLWVNMAGNRFYYAYDPDRNDDSSITYNENYHVHISIDFNVDPCAAVCWHYDGRVLRAFDEITLKGIDGGADTKKLAAAILARGYLPQQCILYPDPAGNARSTKGQPDIVQLRNCGFHNIRVRKKAPGMRQRQLNVNNLMDKALILIHPTNCPELKKDCMAVEQDVITLEKSKKNKNRTHHSDGMDYLCDILHHYSGNKPVSRVERLR
jgi:hypothetical protein